ncbi:hypothetical protein [Apilactobacillus xinyiensis]|uniref:hypothetical protein n=1 Tax=Apilactobacillus xinyiensis TaxID=2841032 RepID=UPI00200F0144|nr:hypothetical protein [Apilactobacillus xinyiensis]MCL0330869.1 hypothetical protein [Apilactobacillus xinyiensis]
MIDEMKIYQKGNIITAKFKCDMLLHMTDEAYKQATFNVCLSDIIKAIDARLQPIDVVTDCQISLDKQDDDSFVIKINDDHGLINMGDTVITK